jgi:hypothetical protein
VGPRAGSDNVARELLLSLPGIDSAFARAVLSHYTDSQWDFHSCLLATMKHRSGNNLIFLINFCVDDTKFHQNW